MALWGIFFMSFLTGFSGAMMPGPMLGVTIDGSIHRGYKAGPLVVAGHGAVEIVLIFLLLFGLRDLFSNHIISGIIAIAGGSFLAWMGYGMIRSVVLKNISMQDIKAQKNKGQGLILAGAVVSITNPFFIIWWASTGLGFLRQSYMLGMLGVLIFFVGHILSDFVWYSLVSVTFSKGSRFITDSVYRFIITVLGIFILSFSVYFFVTGWFSLIN